jgi:uncharacterized membrane protein YqaE (UPF0057 family)
MSMPDPAHDLATTQYKFYKAATRLSNLWYALTIIGLILWILGIILSCVGVFLAAGPVTIFINSVIQSLSSYGY